MEPEQLLVGLGLALRELRTERGVSQERLSLETGVHRNYIGGIERAERQPTVQVIALLAQALEARPGALFARAERLAQTASGR